MAASGEEDLRAAADAAPEGRLRAPSLGPAWSLSVIIAAVKAEGQDAAPEEVADDVRVED